MVGAAAAAVVIGLLSLRLADTSNQLDQARQALAGTGSAAAAQAALATPGHQVVSLDSTSGTRLGEVVYLPDGRGYLVSSAFPGLPSDRTYQLWAMIEGKPISLGLLGARPGQAAFTVSTSGRPSAFAVTVEPAGGVAVPDRAPVASGELSA